MPPKKAPSVNVKTDSPEINAYHRIELEDILKRTSAITGLRIQVYSFFGTANLTFLGFALNARISGLILIAAGMIGLLALIDRELLRYQRRWDARGLQLEEIYAPDKDSAIFHAAIAPTQRLKRGRLRRYWLPVTVFTVEVLMAVLSWWLLGWKWG